MVIASSISTAFAVGGTNIIFKTFDGNASHEVMRITSDQRVGIGTSTPTEKLDVAGNVHLSGAVNCNGCVSSTDLAPGAKGAIGPTGPQGPPGSLVVWGDRVPQGNVITTVDSQGSVGNYNSITMGADSHPIISYWDYTNKDLKVLKCGNLSCTSGNVLTTVDSQGEVGEWSSITIGTDGLPVISYYDRTNHDLKVAHCGNKSCTTGNVLTAVDFSATVDLGSFTSITIGTDGFPIISYWTNPSDDLLVAHCGNNTCTQGNTITNIDGSSSQIGPESSIAIGGDGFPVISYYDWTNQVLKVAHCGNSSCNSGNVLTPVDQIGNGIDSRPIMTIGTDGLPVIAYSVADGISQDIKVTKCLNEQCGSNVKTTIESGSSSFSHPSITIGTDGLPIISNQGSFPNYNLEVIKCGTNTCSGFSKAAIEPPGLSGEFSSITIGADGLPIISYSDDSNNDLKVVHCGSTICKSNWIRR